jgi:hypothetical protein
MLLRFTNTALLALVVVLTLTGLWGIAFTLQGWLFEIHRAAGWAVIALIPWKTVISVRSLRRGLDLRFDRSWMVGLSLLLAALTLGVLWLGLDLADWSRTAVAWQLPGHAHLVALDAGAGPARAAGSPRLAALAAPEAHRLCLAPRRAKASGVGWRGRGRLAHRAAHCRGARCPGQPAPLHRLGRAGLVCRQCLPDHQ